MQNRSKDKTSSGVGLSEMKGIDLFCASPASTAICVSIDKSSVVLQGGRAIDRHNYLLRDARRSTCRGLLNPSSSSSSSSSQSQPVPTKSKAYSQKQNKSKTSKKRSSKASAHLISPLGSSRYLLSDTSFLDLCSGFDPIPASVPDEPSRPLSLNPHDSPALKPPPPPSSSTTSSSPALKPSSSSTPSPVFKCSSSTRSRDQVVVLRVSLHCKGCEGKVRKHISRMEGVTSFSIDFATKKVTVIGEVTPLAVLESVSRVKKAQFWPSASLPSSVGPSSSC